MRADNLRWITLLEKHKDKLQIDDIDKVKNAFKRNNTSWFIWCLKADLICLEYPKGE